MADQELMDWTNNVRKIGGSYYVVLPSSYCKSKKIHRDMVAVYALNEDGSLTLRIREPAPVMRIDERRPRNEQ